MPATSSLSPGHLIRLAIQHADKLFRDRSPECTAAQFEFLDAVSQLKRPSLAGISQHTGADRSTTSKLAETLASRGFVKIEKGEDLRFRFVTLTPSGETEISQARAAAQAAMADLLAPLSPMQRQHFLRALEAIHGARAIADVPRHNQLDRCRLAGGNGAETS